MWNQLKEIKTSSLMLSDFWGRGHLKKTVCPQKQAKKIKDINLTALQ